MNSIGLWMTASVVLAANAFAQDWPHYCGPDRNNISSETGLANAWPEEGPKVLWETEVSDGYSGPALKDGKIYVIDREDENSMLRCLDFASGKELWRCTFADPGEMRGTKFAGTRGIPTITDDAAYLVTGYGTLACIDLKTKKVIWKHSLLTDYDNELHMFGIAQAPFIHGNLLLVAPNTEQVGVAAYDKKTGKCLWVSPSLGKHSYVPPQVVTLCGQEMVVAIGSKERPPRSRGRRSEGDAEETPKKLAKGHVAGLSLKDGSILWDYLGWQCEAAIPFPTPVEGNRLFITGGYDTGSAMIQIVKENSGFAVKEIYTTMDVGSQLHQPIRVGDHFYIGSNSNSRNDGLACFSIDDGKLKWRTKDIDGAPNFERGPFILADGKLIMLDGKSGILYLVTPDSSTYKELASAKMVKENDMAWAPLVLSNGKLLVRDWTTLKCVDLK